MRVDDPRHGSEAGHTQHHRDGEKPCQPCCDAHNRLNVLRQLDPLPRKVSTLGSRRRIQALQALGWSRQRIAEECGYSDQGSFVYVFASDTMLRVTAERIAEAFKRLSMTVPQGTGPNRARTWAKRHGYAPPLAWTNIDDPDDRPRGMAELGHIRPRKPDHEAAACPRCGVRRQVRVSAKGELCVDCKSVERRAS